MGSSPFKMKALLVEYYSVNNSVESQGRKFAFRLLEQLKLLKTESFSGVGLVFYSHLDGLPSTPLGSRTTTAPDLPVFGIEAIVRVLASVSDHASPWHDGFHMIDMESKSLTHLSQYLAPPLRGVSKLPVNRPNGARQMTALLASTIPGIAYVGVLSTGEEIVVYESGNVLARVREK
jgi:hypothetical protein